MFVSLLSSPFYPYYNVFVDLVVVTTRMSLTTLGRLTHQHENGLSYNAPGPFHPPAQVTLPSSSMMLCMYLVGMPWMEPN
jgi:hypothetical protein